MMKDNEEHGGMVKDNWGTSRDFGNDEGVLKNATVVEECQEQWKTTRQIVM